MPKQLDILTTVDEDGHLPAPARRQIAAYLKLYEGSPVHIRVSKPKRSTAANRYYWGIVIAAIQRALAEAGQPASSEAIHTHFKRRYLPARPACVFGLDHVLEPTTTDLDSTQFYEYVESIRYDEDVLALGVVVPDPDPEYQSYRIADEVI